MCRKQQECKVINLDDWREERNLETIYTNLLEKYKYLDYQNTAVENVDTKECENDGLVLLTIR
jgi:hypothetical protein